MYKMYLKIRLINHNGKTKTIVRRRSRSFVGNWMMLLYSLYGVNATDAQGLTNTQVDSYLIWGYTIDFSNPYPAGNPVIYNSAGVKDPVSTSSTSIDLTTYDNKYISEYSTSTMFVPSSPFGFEPLQWSMPGNATSGYFISPIPTWLSAGPPTIKVGSGSNPVSATDYNLQNPIPFGSGNGEVTVSGHNISPVTVSGNSAYFTVSSTFTNNGSVTLTISEVGLFIYPWSFSGLSGVGPSPSPPSPQEIMVLRDVLGSPITLNPGQSVEITYTYSIAT